MQIYYTQILDRKTKRLLADSYSDAGKHIESEEKLLVEMKRLVNGLPMDEEKMYSSDSKQGGNSQMKGKTFVFENIGEITVGSICDKKVSKQAILRYFDTLREEYESNYEYDGLPNYDFETRIKKLSNTLNNEGDHLEMSEKALNETKEILVENLDTIINRGENINNLSVLADRVSVETREMGERVSKLKRDAQIEQYKIYAVIIFVLIAIFYFVFKS